MSNGIYPYIIVGGGTAGASAVEGIRGLDREKAILMIGAEEDLPYDRPTLTKKLWFGQKKVEDIFYHDRDYYARNGVELATGKTVVGLDPESHSVTDDTGKSYRFEKLLLATGGTPRTLTISGGDIDGIYYYRSLQDYRNLRAEATEGRSATVIGGGFIGSELSAALSLQKVKVTMIFPEKYMCSRVLPPDLGQAVQKRFRDHDVRILMEDMPVEIRRERGRFSVRTGAGETVESDILAVGIGIQPSMDLAKSAGLGVADGIVVNQYMQTSHPDVYAAGDNALFPYQALGKQTRVEHWDNARGQGKLAGRNMAGAREPYTYLPYFFSDLYEFGYEAVGEIDSRLEIFADWQERFNTGTVYYLRDHVVRGAMMCNVWNKVDEARKLILRGSRKSEDMLTGAIR